ncbi:MAG: hypothetical protein M3P18_01415, partial [Actinomycetota bacterium]|nr:hypothetical protein [Actinomycetota bacterium]
SFRRFIETHRGALAGVVMEPSPCSREPIAYRRDEVVCSPPWEARFGSTYSWPRVLPAVPYSFVSLGPAAVVGRCVMRSQFSLPNMTSDQVNLNVEVYSNSYKLFVLLWVPRRVRLRHRRGIVPAAGSETP